MALQTSKRKHDGEEDNCAKKSFKDLLRSRHQADRQLSENSREVLQEAVFQLISLHQDTPLLVNEALQTSCNLARSTGEEGGKELLLSNVLNSLSHVESQPDQSVTLTVTEACVRRLLLCQSSQSERKGEDDLQLCIEQIQSVIEQQKFNRQHFVNLLTKEDSLSLETLWSLHKENLLTVSVYITRKMSQSGFVKTFSSDLYQLCKRTGEPRGGFLSGILCILINTGFPEKKEEAVPFRKVSVAILDEIIKSIVDNIGDSPHLEHFVGVTYTEDSLNLISFKKYCTHNLSLLMSHRPSLKVSQAFKQQSNWKFAKVSDQISDLYKQLFLPFGSREVLGVLQRILERHEVNWQTVLSFIATFLVCYQDAAKLIQGHVYELLSEGLENADMESAIIAFLLARQSCLEGLHVFPQYQDWFQQTFCDSSRTPASSRKSFTFLMKFLTNIVPYESAQHLKVHILRPPHVPAKCRQLLTDYVFLAKTRLTDLKESCEVIGGIYDSSSSGTDTKQTDPVESDVEQSLAAFQATGKVPSTVMEASIFRKPYFVGKYLQALLKPRHLPDKPDTRMKMIASLKKADKIPTSMYSKYEEACRRESEQLLQGVFDVDSEDDSMSDAMLSPLAQLQFRLEQLHNTVTSSETDTTNSNGKVSEIISIISEKLDNVLQAKQTILLETSHEAVQSVESQPCEICVNIGQPDMSLHQTQVADALLNGICHTVSADLTSSSPKLSWLTLVIKMLSQHKSFHRPLVQRISSLILSQGTKLNLQHITGLSALVGQMSSLQPLFGAIAFQCSNLSQSYTSTSMIDGLVHCLHPRTGDDMDFVLRFFTSYLEYTFLRYECYVTEYTSDVQGVIPQHLVKIFCMLCWRHLPVTRHCAETLDNNAAITIFTSSKYQELLTESRVSPEDWVAFEIDVHPEEDNLSFAELQDYYNWVVYQHFLGSTVVDVTTICSVLFDSLIRKQVRSEAAIQQPGCGRCIRGNNSCRDNSTNLQTLLQTMLVHLPPCTSIPWLVKYLQSVIKKQDVYDGATSPDVSTQALVLSVFSHVCRLPPYLLFVNRLTDMPTSPDEPWFITLIENIMSPYVSESCYLPSHLSLHLIQGILALQHCRVGASILKQYLLRPLIAVSLMVHWPIVTHILDTCGIEEGDDLVKDFYTCMTWARSCIETGVMSPCPCPSWMCGSALFSLGQQQPDKIAVITDLLTATRLESEVMSTYTQLCLLYLAAGHTDFNTQKPTAADFCTNLTTLLKTFPQLIIGLSEGSVLQTRIASLSARSFQKAVLLRSLCEMGVQDVISLLSESPDILTSIIQLYNATCQQFEDAQYGQCLSLCQLSTCADFLKNVLRGVNKKCLQSLDQSVLQSAGPDFQYLVMSRIRSDR